MEFLVQLQSFGDWGLLALRIAVGAIFLFHGVQKWAMWKMQPSKEMPSSMLAIMRTLSIVEPLSGLAVLLGLLTQLGAFALGIVMVGALYFKIHKWKAKFSGDGGWEYDLMLLAACSALFVLGAGSMSIDRLLLGI